jgi:hypothetical protein
MKELSEAVKPHLSMNLNGIWRFCPGRSTGFVGTRHEGYRTGAAGRIDVPQKSRSAAGWPGLGGWLFDGLLSDGC